MPAGSDSLRAVLLSARSAHGAPGSRTDSRHTGHRTWHSTTTKSDVANSSGAPLDPPGHYFPAKLAMFAGLLKFFFGLLMIGLGGLSVLLKIPLSALGPGLWVGVVVSVSGFLGVCAARRPYAQIYIVSFMSVSILSLAASGLLVVLSATGWARETHKSEIVIFDRETQSEVHILGKILLTQPSVLVTGSLVILGVIDVLLSLACVIMSAKESCGAHMGAYNGPFGLSEGHDRKDRLYRWLGQQKDFLHTIPRYQTKPIPSVSQFVPLSSSASTSTSKGQRYRSTTSFEDEKGSSSVQSNAASSVVFIHPQIPEDRLPRRVSDARGRQMISRDYGPHSLPSMLPLNGSPRRKESPRGSMFNVDYPPSSSVQTHDCRRNRIRRKKSKTRKKRLSDDKPMPLTDKQIDSTYTGMDREIAESFICFAMDPSASERKSSISELIV